jgi:hypothetical protein
MATFCSLFALFGPSQPLKRGSFLVVFGSPAG